MYGYILLATSDGVGIVNQVAVNIQLHVGTTGSGDNHCILGGLVSDFGSLGALTVADAVNGNMSAGNILIDGHALIVNLGVQPVGLDAVGVGLVVGIVDELGLGCVSLGNCKAIKIVGQSGIEEHLLAVVYEGEYAVAGTLVGQSECSTHEFTAVKFHLNGSGIAGDVQHCVVTIQILVVVNNGIGSGAQAVEGSFVALIGIHLTASDGHN